MTITKLLIELALQLGGTIGERIKEAIGETLIKVPGADASPRDIAIATKSHVSADREGKIASERAKCEHPLVKQWQTHVGLVAVSCPRCGTMAAAPTADEAKDALLGKPRRLGDYGPGGE